MLYVIEERSQLKLKWNIKYKTRAGSSEDNYYSYSISLLISFPKHLPINTQVLKIIKLAKSSMELLF